jgi:hypothetical protein
MKVPNWLDSLRFIHQAGLFEALANALLGLIDRWSVYQLDQVDSSLLGQSGCGLGTGGRCTSLLRPLSLFVDDDSCRLQNIARNLPLPRNRRSRERFRASLSGVRLTIGTAAGSRPERRSAANSPSARPTST